MRYCTQCGAVNKPGHRFCVQCGSPLKISPRYQAPTTLPPTATAPTAPAPRPALRVRRGGALLAGAAMVTVAGVVVLISTWLAWGSGSGGSLTGWGWYDVGRTVVSRGGDIANPLFVYYQGYPVFTGLCSLAFGAMMTIAGAVLLLFASRKVAITAIAVSSLALIMAVVNLSSVLRQPGANPGVGLILFLVGAAAGVAGGIIGLRGSARPAVPVAASAPAPALAPGRVEVPSWR